MCTLFFSVFLLNILILRFICIVCINNSFLFIAELCYFVWICPNLFIHSLVDGYLGSFDFGTMNIYVQISGHILSILLEILSSAMAGHFQPREESQIIVINSF